MAANPHAAFEDLDPRFNRSRGVSVRNSIVKKRLSSNQSADQQTNFFAGIPTQGILSSLANSGVASITIKGQWWTVSEWMSKELPAMCGHHPL